MIEMSTEVPSSLLSNGFFNMNTPDTECLVLGESLSSSWAFPL